MYFDEASQFGYCKKCDAAYFHFKRVNFANIYGKSFHIGVYCGRCNSFIKWVPHNWFEKKGDKNV